MRYTLPATNVQPGMTTKDNRPVLRVSPPHISDGDRLWVTVQVGQPRRPGLGHADTNRWAESWHLPADIPITLGVFDGTDEDASGHPDAGPLPTPDGRTIVIRRDRVPLALSYVGAAALGQSTWLWRVVNHTRSFASSVTWAATLDQARAHALIAATGKAPSQRAARALEAISAAPLPRLPDELEPDEVFLWQSQWWILRRHLFTEDQGDLTAHLGAGVPRHGQRASHAAGSAGERAAGRDPGVAMNNTGLWDGGCFTPGRSTTGAAGTSFAATATPPSGQGSDTHRCGPCLDAIGLLVPHVPDRLSELNLIDKTASGQWCQRVATMIKTELFEQAALVHRRLRSARCG